jgi:hypothetical protein
MHPPGKTLAKQRNTILSLDSTQRALESAKLVVGAIPILGSSAKDIFDIGIEVCRTTQVSRKGRGAAFHLSDIGL